MSISLLSIPFNYSKIDNFVSRSAQPTSEKYIWLKEQGVTDIISFRSIMSSVINYNERKIVNKLGMNFSQHTIFNDCS